MPPSKVIDSADAALADLGDGATIMVGGSASAGVPQGLIQALVRRGTKRITCIGQACHHDRGEGYDIAALVAAGQVTSLVTTPPSGSRWNEAVLQRWRQGSLELQVIAPGVLAERIRAAGAGVGGFLVRPQEVPALDDGKERQLLEGEEYVVEPPLRADFALVRAHRADRLGNLVYLGEARNWNPLMSTAASIAIVEVDEVVEVGDLDAERVITPGIFIDRIVIA